LGRKIEKKGNNREHLGGREDALSKGRGRKTYHKRDKKPMRGDEGIKIG